METWRVAAHIALGDRKQMCTQHRAEEKSRGGKSLLSASSPAPSGVFLG